MLAFAYAIERGTFKIMIDRMGSFRMVIGVEAVMALHSLILSSSMLLTTLTCGRRISKILVCCLWLILDVRSGLLFIFNVENNDCIFQSWLIMFLLFQVMAVLDSIQLLLVAISGSRVTPILTAVLVHFSILLSTLFNMLFFSDQKFGSTLIFITSMLALAPVVLAIVWSTLSSTRNVMANHSAWNTIIFGRSCGAAVIYKEQTQMAFAKPVVQTLLKSMLLSLFSFVFTFLISPLLCPLQGLADTPSLPALDDLELKVESWIHQYPSKEI